MERKRFDWMSVPIEVDIKVGKKWGELKKWEKKTKNLRIARCRSAKVGQHV